MNKEKIKQYWLDFHKSLDEVGINVGDIVYVGSDLGRILVQAKGELEIASKEEQFEFVNMLIDELKNHVTDRGTILFPVYSWAFCKGNEFDYYRTQGEVGALNNFVLNNRKDFVRTKHPIYSFMVCGKDADYLAGLDNQDSWGEMSPFHYLHVNNAKELDLSVSVLRSMTFKHYVEQCVSVPYRHFKYFLADYIDKNGQRETRCYSMYVRDLSVSLKSVQQIEFYKKADCATETSFRKWPISVVELGKAYAVMADDLLNNNGANLYEFTDYTIDWGMDCPAYEIGYLKERKLL